MYHQYTNAASGRYPDNQRLVTLHAMPSRNLLHLSLNVSLSEGRRLYYMFYCMEHVAAIPGFTRVERQLCVCALRMETQVYVLLSVNAK